MGGIPTPWTDRQVRKYSILTNLSKLLVKIVFIGLHEMTIEFQF